MDNILGQKVAAIRPMTKAELKNQGWDGFRVPVVLVLQNGLKIFASCDEEGNGPGELFTEDIKGEQSMIYVGK